MTDCPDRTKRNSQFEIERVLADLEERGVAVIDNVLCLEECDKCFTQYRQWVKQFEDADIPFLNLQSLIQYYRIGHFEPSWRVRLKAKDVFSKIWGTNKLLTSVDAVALSSPPEEGKTSYREPDDNWLHVDQGSQRIGRHAYQGAVYLEETTEQDYCFRVLLKSHKFHTEFYEEFPYARKETKDFDYYELSSKEKSWYESKRCELTYIPVPKGGMVLWDSRTVHDNNKPAVNRPDPKWRNVVFVCMTPASWASEKDLEIKREAYNDLLMTTHWPSQRVKTFIEFYKPGTGVMKDMQFIDTLPEIALTSESKLLMGVELYDFEDGEPNGPDPPEWKQ